MKKELNMKFEDFPLNVPSEKRITNKLDSLIQELEECGSALTAQLAIKHWNKYIPFVECQLSKCHQHNSVY